MATDGSIPDWREREQSRRKRAEQNRDVKSAIVRALPAKFAKPEAAKPLLKEFMQAQDSSGGDIQWVIGNALCGRRAHGNAGR